MQQHDITTLSNEVKEYLDQPLNIGEMALVANLLANNYPYRTDGLAVDFDKVFWPKIKNDAY